MPRGAKPGERRGGREKGQQNRTTIERAALAERIIEEATGKLARKLLEEFAPMFGGLASAFQPTGRRARRRDDTRTISRSGPKATRNRCLKNTRSWRRSTQMRLLTFRARGLAACRWQRRRRIRGADQEEGHSFDLRSRRSSGTTTHRRQPN